MNLRSAIWSVALILYALGTFGYSTVNSAFAAPGINEQIPFYGTLNNSSGTPLDGTYGIVFRLYDAPTDVISQNINL